MNDNDIEYSEEDVQMEIGTHQLMDIIHLQFSRPVEMVVLDKKEILELIMLLTAQLQTFDGRSPKVTDPSKMI